MLRVVGDEQIHQLLLDPAYAGWLTIVTRSRGRGMGTSMILGPTGTGALAITTIRSASKMASSMPCVTISTVSVSDSLLPQVDELLLQAGPGQRVQRAERLVEQQHLGRPANARATAVRCAMPPETWPGRLWRCAHSPTAVR